METLPLPNNWVDLWHCDLNSSRWETHELWERLSSPEQERANRYRFAPDRNSFIQRGCSHNRRGITERL